MLKYKKTEIHGHRGCRGYFPENTIEGFIHALSLDTDAIEMDIVISKDMQIVVSHEHFMHHKKCLWPNLKSISKEQAASLLLYEMDYNEIKRFDCGLLPHQNYPLMKSIGAFKPLLKEVINQVEKACKVLNRTPIIYNIEIKSEPALVGVVQPEYETYVNSILDTLAPFNLKNRLVIQSFDKKILSTLKHKNNHIPLSLLVEDEKNPLDHIHELGFLPQIFASDYIYLNQQNIDALHAQKVKVYAFTVNKIESLNHMLSLGVDALITDYPDIAARCVNNYI